MILHVDMDAFYASIEERENPALRGQPVIVGGAPEKRGVVCAANYVARQFGVHSAMPSAMAKRLCPHAVFLPSRMNFYAQVSKRIRDIFHRYTPLVEPLSLDEAFLDVTGSRGLFGSPAEIGRLIKEEISEALDLIASVGVAPNKFLAKIASDLDKPDGFVVVEEDAIQEFLDSLPVARLWGVGRQTGKVFQRLGVKTIADLRQLPRDVLRSHFGRHGEQLWRLARGVDERVVVPDRDAKSISHETTFSTNVDEMDVLRAWLLELTEQVARRLRRHDLRGRIVHVKIRFADFHTITRSRKLAEPTASTDSLWEVAADLLAVCLRRDRNPVRLLGMGVSQIDCTSQTQRLLFGEAEHRRNDEIDRMSDQIRSRFGHGALRRGSTLQHDAQHRPQPRPRDEP